MGLYSTTIRDAALEYPSSTYYDDLAWGAAWLYKLTGNQSYLSEAQTWFTAAQNPTGLLPRNSLVWNWDNEMPGVELLLSDFSNWQNETVTAPVRPHSVNNKPLSQSDITSKNDLLKLS